MTTYPVDKISFVMMCDSGLCSGQREAILPSLGITSFFSFYIKAQRLFGGSTRSSYPQR